MDVEKVDQKEEIKVKGRSRLDNTGKLYQALKKIITEAIWIPSEYRKIAGSVENITVLNELYLCACDHMPLEKVLPALKTNNPEYLIAVRKSWLKDRIDQSYTSDITELKKQIDALEKQNQMLEISIESAINGALTNDRNDRVPSGEMSFDDFTPVPISDDKSTVQQKTKITWWHKSSKKKKSKKTMNVSDAFDQADLVDAIMASGFDNDQIVFLLNCIESAVDLEIIKYIAHPEYPVNVMQQLRRIHENIKI